MRNIHTPRSSTTDPPTTASSARMPYDRANPTAPPSSSTRSQPQAPSLAKRTPIVPKLAAKASPTPASQRHSVTLATPVPRRAAARSESTLNGSNSYGSSSGLGVNYTSPAVAKLAHQNVTPRSGSRQSRLSSANTSPNPADNTAVDHWDSRSGLGISASSLEPPRSTPSKQRDSKFFYASDASKGAQQPQPAPRVAPTSQPKGPTFFYANGNNLPGTADSPDVATPPILSPSLASSPPDPMASKFMYANGTPDLKPSLMNTGGSVVSTSSRTPSVRPVSGPSLGSGSTVSTSSRVSVRPVSGPALAPRIPSPPKPTSHPHMPTPSAPGPSIAERRNVFAHTPHLSQPTPNLRRISADTPSRRSSGHSRSGSLVAEPPSGSRIMAASPTNLTPLPSPLAFHNPGLSMASVLEAAEALDDNDDNESTLGSEVTSPKSATGSSTNCDQLNELVANARRERKVQDLQITNASLEAINRTLERQLKKQTNELRRFKRMARQADRLTAPSSRIASGSTILSDAVEGPLNQLSLSDLSEEDAGLDDEEEDPEDSEPFSDSEEDSTGSGGRAASPITMASRDVRHRRQDEKRLQVDLSKHRQLLVDSQKMNQSIKRCLGWTEALISEGRRALAYQVRVSEVDVGSSSGGGQHAAEAPADENKPYVYDGAALWEHQGGNEDEEHHGSDVSDDEDEDGQEDEDADADDTMRLRIERLRPVDFESSGGGNKNAQDRDSGIVLAGDAV